MSSFTDALAGGIMRGIFGSEPKKGNEMNNVEVTKEVIEEEVGAVLEETTESQQLARAVEALLAIHMLQENKKLRSWKGNEAQKIARKALEDLGAFE